MTTIVANQNQTVVETIQVNGAPVAISTNANLTAQLFTSDGLTALSVVKNLTSADPGSNWPAGVVAVGLTATDTAQASPPDAMLVITQTVPTYAVYRFRLFVEIAGSPTHSALFIKDFVVNELRQDRLLLAAQTFFGGQVLSDDYLWSKVVSAESQIRHQLRVPLVPTTFFPYTPAASDIAALPAGMPYEIDPPYDYDPDFFQGEKWGFIVSRQKPIVSINKIRFAYPAPTNGFFDVPLDWLRIDPKYGHIRMVPATTAFAAPLSAFLMQALGGGKTIPFMIQMTYVAGLTNAAQTYPELVDAVKKLAVLKMIEDAFAPQSGSISADGLSQSLSVDMEKYRGMVDDILYGPKGTNGGLMTEIHGVRTSLIL